MNQMLGELVILEHILSGSRTAYVSHLSVENQSRAKNDLTNLKTQKESRVVQALEQAYGLAQVREGDIDSALSIDKHLNVLKSGAKVQPQLAANLATALDGFIPALLELRYPRHPRLGAKLSTQRVERLLEKFGEIIDSDKKLIAADKTLVEEMRGTLGELGLVRTTETAVHLIEDRLLQDIEKKRLQQVSEQPEVGEIRRFIDEYGKMGLQPEALDLVTRAYARWSARTFVSGGEPYEPKAGKAIPDHVVLEKPALPSPEAWNKALATAGGTLGVALPGKALHADNLKRLEAEVGKQVKGKAPGCARLARALGGRLAELDLPADAARAKTATSADALCAELGGRTGKGLAEALAAFTAVTSVQAVGRSIGSADKVAAVLEDKLVFGAFMLLKAREADLEGASELLAKVGACLRQDEVIEPAADRLRALAEHAQRLLYPPPLPGKVIAQASWNASGPEAVLLQLRKAVADVEAALEGEVDAVTLVGSFTVTATPRKER
jgi:hypothetical protein